jgi:hypothetical protein
MIRILIILAWLAAGIIAGYWFVYCVRSMLNGAPYWALEGAIVLGLFLIVDIACLSELIFRGKGGND